MYDYLLALCIYKLWCLLETNADQSEIVLLVTLFQPIYVLTYVARGDTNYGDQSNTLYVERLRPSGTSVVVKSHDWFRSTIPVISGVEDFEIKGAFMFASKTTVS